MKINEITLNPQMLPVGDPTRIRAGEVVVEGGHVVEKILFHPASDVFNKGREISGASYAVFFEGIPERRILMAGTVSSVEVVIEKKNPVAENVPDLPE